MNHYLTLSLLLFLVGTVGFIVKKNVLAMFLCVELMLNAANLAFVAFARDLGQLQGQVFVFLVMVVAAAEAAVGLAIMIVLYRCRGTLNPDEADTMKG
ncbi:MAG: NADH-quinone oxidoreductase subunit NuoK [Acidobacteriota bacterium]|jgi:NADH-quinone oxidoreductase subunit K|nr:NADH-quinone oxidoreductase subunit NuoK [Acidobacteriota bacterium]NLT33561.1 NADH-quinone oxidoreductase subunit NuoK [Acidobacteriota bacterium]